MNTKASTLIQEYFDFLNNPQFPCVAAKAALAKEQVKCMVAGHMACPKDDKEILNFLYQFIDDYRSSSEFFHSATIIFESPYIRSEAMFDDLMWQRLQAISDLDSMNYDYDTRVDANPLSPDFSFSLKQEACFVIGIHPANSRPARRFQYAALTFNPHAQFEELRSKNRYDKMKNIVRKRDISLSGNVNPMLEDYGKASEAYQYSGQQYGESWQCPLKINHGKSTNHSTT